MTAHADVGFSNGALPGKVMVIDDDPVFSGQMAALLRTHGYEVEVAANRHQTLQRLKTFQPQVVIADIGIGRQGDFDLVRQLLQPRSNLLSIVSTPLSDIHTALEAMHAGAYDYLCKPVDEFELLAKLKRCFEKIRLENRLRQAQKMEAIGSLAGGIAHEFNNILAAILGYTELARLDIRDNDRATENLDKVLKAGFRAKELVSQILAFSRQAEQEKIPVHIGAIVKEVLKFLRASFPATIEIRQSIPGDFGNVLADPGQIHQVLMNICTNAGHAMRDSGGTLEIRLEYPESDPDFERYFPGRKPREYLRLTIADTGPGMSPDVRRHVFDPYFTTKANEQGTGLGLAVALGIIKGHSGHITVNSVVGKGATFAVYLPLIVKRPKPARLNSLDSLPSGDERILLVDDEPDIVHMERQMLERLGYRVTALTQSMAALDVFVTDPQTFDLVITDMTMPAMTGEQLAKNIRKAHRTIPIILCTGYNEKISSDTAREIGISQFLTKPLTLEELARAIRQLLDSRTRDGRND